MMIRTNESVQTPLSYVFMWLYIVGKCKRKEHLITYFLVINNACIIVDSRYLPRVFSKNKRMPSKVYRSNVTILLQFDDKSKWIIHLNDFLCRNMLVLVSMFTNLLMLVMYVLHLYILHFKTRTRRIIDKKRIKRYIYLQIHRRVTDDGFSRFSSERFTCQRDENIRQTWRKTNYLLTRQHFVRFSNDAQVMQWRLSQTNGMATNRGMQGPFS